MNGEVCCILGVCCPPEARAAALSTELQHDGICTDKEHADKIADYLMKHFDLVPSGMMHPLIAHIAKLAREKK
jgi:hypothetical protein